MNIIDGKNVNPRFDALLADYAQKNTTSKGRKHTFSPDPFRTPYQRDRSRIINSPAFRRLKGKMQVLPPNSGDHFRNRLTHTLEVANITRDLARMLQLNEDLAECLALSHDLGHPPFGHAGEWALNECLARFGKKFEHNVQSLRVVMYFAQPYLHLGLNLSHEVLEGLRKHDANLPHAEAELVDLADEMAYTAADTEDALRMKAISLEMVKTQPFIQRFLKDIPPIQQENITRPFLVRKMIAFGIKQLAEDTKKRIKRHNITTKTDFLAFNGRVVAFADPIMKDFLTYKHFLKQNFYQRPQMQEITQKGQKIIKQLFNFYQQNPEQVPQKRLSSLTSPERNIADHIAGMTDEYAIKMWEKWCG